MPPLRGQFARRISQRRGASRVGQGESLQIGPELVCGLDPNPFGVWASPLYASASTADHLSPAHADSSHATDERHDARRYRATE